MSFKKVTSIKNGEKYLVNFSLIRAVYPTEYTFAPHLDTPAKTVPCTVLDFGPEDWNQFGYTTEKNKRYVKETPEEIEALLK